jgi:outer membrane protein assembly factor BamB
MVSVHLIFIKKHPQMRKTGILILVLLLSGCRSDVKDSSPLPTRWMGPNGNGIYPDKGLLREWPPGGPEILWTYEDLGIGFSSAVIQNGYAYITGMVDSTGFLYKLNLEGELIYRVPYGTEWTGSTPGTRGSPTVVRDKIYLISGRGKVICFNQTDGSIIWSKEMFEDFDGTNITWGINETPLVDGDIIYITPGGKKDNVVALNRHTGELVWSCPGEGEVSAYCSPLLFEHNGRKILTTYTARHLLGIDPGSGNLLWSVDAHWEWSVHSYTPVYRDGFLFFPTGLEVGGGKLRLSENGDSVSVVWMNDACDYRYTGLLLDGYIYGSFSYNKDFTWRCVDWETGKEMFRSRELGFGCSAIADGRIYTYTINGELVMIRPDSSRLNIISRTKVPFGSGLNMSMPRIDNGVIYIRHGNALVAYDLKGEQSSV